tara:strand:+ start:1907 stop:2158 length:252 start_codon:yes stop_codon:yes gene_type:complete
MEKQREKWMCQEYFTYLYALRDSGITNMWCADSYLEDEYGLERADARAVCSVWMSECKKSIDDDKKVDFDEYEKHLIGFRYDY